MCLDTITPSVIKSNHFNFQLEQKGKKMTTCNCGKSGCTKCNPPPQERLEELIEEFEETMRSEEIPIPDPKEKKKK